MSDSTRLSYAEMVGCRCGCWIKPYLQDSLKRQGGVMSERIIMYREVEYEAGREYVWWTVRDKVSGYNQTFRNEDEAKAHATYLATRT